MKQEQAYQFAAERMAGAAMTPDAQEGFKAFLEKRHAQYTQRPPVT
jgi:1,4-dihydroxy-2-naphthoyl-CoA synthase